MSDILFVRPADDSAAIQVAVWGQAVRHMAGSLKTDDLCGPLASRTSVDKKLATGVRHLFWFGHGTEKELIANGNALVDVKNVGFLGFDDELGFPATAPLPMMLAVTRGLRCMFQQGHNIGCAASQLRKAFDAARLEYKTNGTAYGLSASDAKAAWLFAKSNRYSVRTHGDATTTL